MAKLSAMGCEAAQPHLNKDRLFGDGDGLFLRIRRHGKKTWVIEYELNSSRTKYTIGRYSRNGARGDSISAWLRNGEQSVARGTGDCGSGKAARRAGHDPAAEWEAQLSSDREADRLRVAALEVERTQPTVEDAVELFMAKMMAGKNSAPGVLYRFARLTEIIGTKKIRDLTRQDIIAAVDTIGEGRRDGRTAKQFAGEVLTLQNGSGVLLKRGNGSSIVRGRVVAARF